VNKAFEKYEKQMKAAKQSGKNSKSNQEKVLKQAERTQAKRGKGKNEPMDDAGAAQSNVPQKWSDYSVQFHFPEPTELAPPLMQLIDADFKYPGRDDFGLKNVNIGIDMGSRIAIVGPNGAGKTTLMNLLSGEPGGVAPPQEPAQAAGRWGSTPSPGGPAQVGGEGRRCCSSCSARLPHTSNAYSTPAGHSAQHSNHTSTRPSACVQGHTLPPPHTHTPPRRRP
jgi:hypothetical protein